MAPDPDGRPALADPYDDADELAARLRFRLGGAVRTPLATARGDDPFVAARDAANGSWTYGAGRVAGERSVR